MHTHGPQVHALLDAEASRGGHEGGATLGLGALPLRQAFIRKEYIPFTYCVCFKIRVVGTSLGEDGVRRKRRRLGERLLRAIHARTHARTRRLGETF